MMRIFVSAILIFSILGGTALGQGAPGGSIAGRVVDRATGLAISSALVETQGTARQSAVTDAGGNFTISNLPPGIYQLNIVKAGYQTTLSDAITLVPGQSATVTLALESQRTGTSGLRTIGHTTTRASESLQRSSVIYHSVSAETIQNLGYFRASDYLQTLPQVNLASGTTGGSDTPSPGDDQYLDFRGIGNLETTTLLDGHPIGVGLNRGKNFGYNWESSPTFALRDVVVTYGSGLAGLSPYSAIGGVANMLTLDPTPQNQLTFTQGYGTFAKLVTTATATGMLTPRFGYALAYGTQAIDGPYRNDSFYQPASAYDQAAPVGSKVYNLGIYPYDTTVANRGAMVKFRYGFGDPQHLSHVTFSSTWSAYWDNKTGNGDQDYLPYNTALAMGDGLLASYKPGPPTTPPYTVTNLPNCPKGEFLPSSLNGNPYGFGPNGLPDGGPHCVTPAQYATFASGWQGAGTTWQAFHQAQYDVKVDTPTSNGQVVFDGYTNIWSQLYDRTWELPWNAAKSTGTPYGSGYGFNPYWTSPAVSASGFIATDQYFWKDMDFGMGFAYNNYAYNLQTIGTPASNPTVNDNSYFMQYVYHPVETKYSLYFNAAQVWSTITNKWTFNPRLAFVYNLTNNDVLRVAGGTAATQPYASQVFTPASLVAPGSLPGNINCTGLTIIGSVGNPVLGPERANDIDLSYGHRFAADSQIQASIYSENVSAKIFPEPINVNTLPPGFINTAPYQKVVNSQCGGTGQLGVNSQDNVGRMLAQGLDIQGRQRIDRHFFFDYEYSIETSVLKAADLLLLQNNPTYILGAQLPGVPAHKWQLAADGTVGKNIDLRYTQYYVGINNPKNTTAFNYGEFTASVPLGEGRFNLALTNVWNQYAQWNGLIGNGVPLALNQYASPAQYARYIGAGATESYGIPSQQIYFAYTFHTIWK